MKLCSLGPQVPVYLDKSQYESKVVLDGEILYASTGEAEVTRDASCGDAKTRRSAKRHRTYDLRSTRLVLAAAHANSPLSASRNYTIPLGSNVSLT